MEGQKSPAEALKQLESLQLPDLPQVQSLRSQLTEAVRLIAEYPSRFEQLEAEHGWPEQFDRRSDILRSAGLTRDIHGHAFYYPSYDEIRAKMLERPELLAKMNQGFVRLQPVPIGAPLSAYFTALEEGLRRYAEEKRLRATDGTALELNPGEALWKWKAYETADSDGALVYEPQTLGISEDHVGKTKAQLIAEHGPTQVLLTENLRDIPREGRGLTIGGRPQLEAGKSAGQYLEMAGKGPYELESPYALETEVAHVLTHLHETGGEVLDDYRSGSAAFCPGTWLPALGGVPCVYFNRGGGQLRVIWNGPVSPGSDGGVRSGVRVI